MAKRLPYPLTKIEEETAKVVNVKYADHLTDRGYVQATRWPNGEGVTIDMDGVAPFNLTWSQFTALKRAIKATESRGA